MFFFHVAKEQRSPADEPEEQPRTPPVRRQRIPECGDSPQGVEDKRSKKSDVSLDQVAEELSNVGCDHIIFQKKHARMNAPDKRGHWRAFLNAVANNYVHRCAACQQLYQEFILGISPQPEAPQAPEAPVAPETGDTAPALEPAAKDSEPQGRRRGRPRKSEKCENVLLKWIEANRKGIYLAVNAEDREPFEYYCVPCKKRINFFRDGITYLQTHERNCGRHVQGLQTLGLQKDGKEVKGRSPCNGAALRDSEGLGKLKTSLLLWMQSGQPLILGDGSPMALCSWKCQGDTIFVRHQDCNGAMSVGACHSCKSLVVNKKLSLEVAQWGYRIDCAALAYEVCHGRPEDIVSQKYLMMSRDYKQLDLAGEDMEQLLKLEGKAFVHKVRRSFESINRKKRNAACQSFMDTRLRGLAEFNLGDMQQSIFGGLIKNYHAAILDSGHVVEQVWPSDILDLTCLPMLLLFSFHSQISHDITNSCLCFAFPSLIFPAWCYMCVKNTV